MEETALWVLVFGLRPLILVSFVLIAGIIQGLATNGRFPTVAEWTAELHKLLSIGREVSTKLGRIGSAGNLEPAVAPLDHVEAVAAIDATTTTPVTVDTS